MAISENTATQTSEKESIEKQDIVTDHNNEMDASVVQYISDPEIVPVQVSENENILTDHVDIDEDENDANNINGDMDNDSNGDNSSGTDKTIEIISGEGSSSLELNENKQERILQKEPRDLEEQTNVEDEVQEIPEKDIQEIQDKVIEIPVDGDSTQLSELVDVNVDTEEADNIKVEHINELNDTLEGDTVESDGNSGRKRKLEEAELPEDEPKTSYKRFKSFYKVSISGDLIMKIKLHLMIIQKVKRTLNQKFKERRCLPTN